MVQAIGKEKFHIWNILNTEEISFWMGKDSALNRIGASTREGSALDRKRVKFHSPIKKQDLGSGWEKSCQGKEKIDMRVGKNSDKDAKRVHPDLCIGKISAQCGKRFGNKGLNL
jgi:hypothetical protein